MFRLSVVDHLRLNFGHAVQNYTVHAQAAERLAALAWKVRIAVLALVGVSLALAVAAVMTGGAAGGGRWLQIAAAVVTGLAFAAHAVNPHAWRRRARAGAPHVRASVVARLRALPRGARGDPG